MASSLAVETNLGKRRLAFEYLDGQSPLVVFLPGLASNMSGTKASWLHTHCSDHQQAYLRFDYSGHGASSGYFVDGTIGLWLEDCLAIVDHLIEKPAIFVGSSMGGWMMLQIALHRPDKVAGLIGMASAPDFTGKFISKLSDQQRSEMEAVGKIALPSIYGDPLIITSKLIDEASHHYVLNKPIPVNCPCHLIHGQEDPDVPWSISVELAAMLKTPHVTVELIKDGDHRLSRRSDLNRLSAAIERMSVYLKEKI